jgi:hypothetical protein
MRNTLCHGLGVVASVALCLLAWSASAADIPSETKAGLKLLKEGDSLADEGKTTDAEITYQKAFQQILPGMRGIPFKHEVKRDVTAREDLRGVLVKEIEEELSPGEFHANEVGMKALGLLPRSLELKETMVRILTEEIAAFYDTKTKTMHLIKEPEAKAKKPLTFLEKLMGRTGGFDKDEQKMVLAHELTHALADQNFNLDDMRKFVKGDDDRDLALSALIEGEATLTMFGAQMGDWDGSKIAQTPAENWSAAMNLMSLFMPALGGPSLKKAPAILSESLTFPYFRGMVFCAYLTNHGGWDSLNEAYREPPLSTEQILHPEKYRVKPDPPTAIDLGSLDAPAGWKEVGRNVLGEMQLAVLLRGQSGKRAAAGWDGDTFAAFEGPEDRLGLVWLSTWDSDQEAREFLESYLKFQTAKLGADIPDPEVVPDSSRRPNQGAVYAIERRGSDVAVVEGFPTEPTEKLLEAAFGAKKTEKTKDKPAAAKKSDKGEG